MADQSFKFDRDRNFFIPAEFEAPNDWGREYLCEPAPSIGAVLQRAGVEEPRRPKSRMLTLREEMEMAELEQRLMAHSYAIGACSYPKIKVKSSPAIARGEILVESGGKVVARVKNIGLREGEPCSPTCSFHVTHPCEKCGRQWGSKKKEIMARKDVFWRK